MRVCLALGGESPRQAPPNASCVCAAAATPTCRPGSSRWDTRASPPATWGRRACGLAVLSVAGVLTGNLLQVRAKELSQYADTFAEGALEVRGRPPWIMG